jgi:hypothetical protein
VNTVDAAFFRLPFAKSAHLAPKAQHSTAKAWGIAPECMVSKTPALKARITSTPRNALSAVILRGDLNSWGDAPGLT